MKTIAIIPARSGSKGLRDKNIKSFNGEPLIAYSIKAAVESGIFDTIMVSTDSKQYAEIAMEYGAEVPFLRSDKTSSDEATTRECILEVVENYRGAGKKFDRFMILQPTSPLRTAKDIINANNLYNEKGAKTVISVCEMDHSPMWSNIISSDLSLNGFLKKENQDRRQSLDKYYRINGAIYLHDVEHYLANENCYDDKAFAYIMKKNYSVDIDDEFDFCLAEYISKNLDL